MGISQFLDGESFLSNSAFTHFFYMSIAIAKIEQVEEGFLQNSLA
jgi:hypothetical protein